MDVLRGDEIGDAAGIARGAAALRFVLPRCGDEFTDSAVTIMYDVAGIYPRHRKWTKDLLSILRDAAESGALYSGVGPSATAASVNLDDLLYRLWSDLVVR